MKRKFLIAFLLSTCMAAAQEKITIGLHELAFDLQPTVAIHPVIPIKGEAINNGGFRRALIIDFAFPGVIDEFRHQPDISDSAALMRQFNYTTDYFIGNDSVTIDFLPVQVNKADRHLPVYPHKQQIDYRELEFQVLKNNVPIIEWRPISALPEDKAYSITFAEAGSGDFMPWPSLHAGKFQLAVGEKLLVNIRKKATTKIIQHMYVERVKAVPEPTSINQFPAGTSIQDILNKEIAKPGSWVISDELEMEEGNSLLFGFERDYIGKKIIEYSFGDDNWKTLEGSSDGLPTISPYFLFIEKPPVGKTIDLKLRYRHQRESVEEIKIIVKPKPKSTSWIKVAAGITLAALLFITGFYFNRRQNKKKLQRLTLKKEELESKLQLLSGQLNPHFLFNSLNSIQNLVNKEEAGKATQYLSEVAGFLRTVMDAGKKEYISLQEELHIAESYLKLEQKRKPFEYTIEYACAVSATQVDFAPLLLQPVLENCIHHGFSQGQSHPLLAIHVSCEEKTIHVRISDNGKGFDTDSAERGQGMALVEKRIALMNEKLGYKAISSVTNSDSNGTVTTFTLQNWI